MTYLSDLDEYAIAMTKIDFSKEYMPTTTGGILIENVNCYNKVKAILECPEMEQAHKFCLDVNFDDLGDEEATKVDKIYDLGVDRGFLPPFDEKKNNGGQEDVCPDCGKPVDQCICGNQGETRDLGDGSEMYDMDASLYESTPEFTDQDVLPDDVMETETPEDEDGRFDSMPMPPDSLFEDEEEETAPAQTEEPSGGDDQSEAPAEEPKEETPQEEPEDTSDDKPEDGGSDEDSETGDEGSEEKDDGGESQEDSEEKGDDKEEDSEEKDDEEKDGEESDDDDDDSDDKPEKLDSETKDKRKTEYKQLFTDTLNGMETENSVKEMNPSEKKKFWDAVADAWKDKEDPSLFMSVSEINSLETQKPVKKGDSGKKED